MRRLLFADSSVQAEHGNEVPAPNLGRGYRCFQFQSILQPDDADSSSLA